MKKFLYKLFGWHDTISPRSLNQEIKMNETKPILLDLSPTPKEKAQRTKFILSRVPEKLGELLDGEYKFSKIRKSNFKQTVRLQMVK